MASPQNSVLTELYKYNPSAIIELYQLDLTPLQEYYTSKGAAISPTSYYFQNGYSKNPTSPNVEWNSVSYKGRPIQMDGVQVSSAGEIARPSLTVANHDLFFTQLCKSYANLAGAKIRRIRTFVKFIDETNFKKNLVQNSEYNATYWTLPLGGATLTSGQSDPLGGTGAVRFTNGNSISSVLRLNLATSIVANGTDKYTFSFYAKKISGSGVSSAGLADENDLTYTDRLITGQWTRISWTATPTAGTKTYFDLHNNATNNLVIDFFGVQIEKGQTLTEYQKIGTTWNPTADVNAKFPDDVFVIDRMSEEVPGQITFELAPAWDVEGVQLPRRQVVANICPWTYKKDPCTWSSSGVTSVISPSGIATSPAATYTAVATTTNGSGTGAKLNVTKNAANVYTVVTVANPGTGYSNGNTLTVKGSLLGGVDGTNNLTVNINGVTNQFYDQNNSPVSTAAEDYCGKTLNSCKIRFGSRALPFGGFPSAGLYGKPI